ncbi:Nicotinamide-nucleotide_adenylyltransferase [Hexamita inflata]|uniref:Nicotinamide-nucleotide adenylyltransferase n=1 Tax=Hexamita inflata TaxID=28002 RepID=A0AA86PLB6_9EUKA|nr:Nicotinamide-nucleotide adenylyltransferase [Hexamita inflata]
MPILVLNGSLNPITLGHVKLLENAKLLAERLFGPVTKIYVSPTCDAYPYKSLLPAVHRIAMINLALSSSSIQQLTEINNDEVLSPTFSPTYQVMKSLKQKHPTDQILLVCGTDLINGMLNRNYWPEFNVRSLFNEIELLCFNRPNGNGSISAEKIIQNIKNDFLKEFESKIHITEEIIGEMSSSAAREGRTDFLDEKVVKYIKENGLCQK